MGLLWRYIVKRAALARRNRAGRNAKTPVCARRRVVGKDPDVVEPGAGELAEQPGYAVLEHLAADKADVRVLFGLCSEMLPGAKADLEPDRSGRCRKQGRWVEQTSLRLGNRDP